MGDARYTKDGLLIPNRVLKSLGGKLRIRRSKGVLILESKQHETARKNLAKIVKKLRGAGGGKLGPISEDEIGAIVNEVRQARASNR